MESARVKSAEPNSYSHAYPQTLSCMKNEIELGLAAFSATSSIPGPRTNKITKAEWYGREHISLQADSSRWVCLASKSL